MGEGDARTQPGPACVHNPLHPARSTHRGCTLEHSTFQNRPRSHAGHTPSRPQVTNIPTRGHADLPTLAEGDSAWRDPYAHTRTA